MAKHNFIAYRDDRFGDSQPITFDGDASRSYVPLRLPWTLCIQDRVPPGYVAVSLGFLGETIRFLILFCRAANSCYSATCRRDQGSFGLSFDPKPLIAASISSML